MTLTFCHKSVAEAGEVFIYTLANYILSILNSSLVCKYRLFSLLTGTMGNIMNIQWTYWTDELNWINYSHSLSYRCVESKNCSVLNILQLDLSFCKSDDKNIHIFDRIPKALPGWELLHNLGQQRFCQHQKVLTLAFLHLLLFHLPSQLWGGRWCSHISVCTSSTAAESRLLLCCSTKETYTHTHRHRQSEGYIWCHSTSQNINLSMSRHLERRRA